MPIEFEVDATLVSNSARETARGEHRLLFSGSTVLLVESCPELRGLAQQCSDGKYLLPYWAAARLALPLLLLKDGDPWSELPFWRFYVSPQALGVALSAVLSSGFTLPSGLSLAALAATLRSVRDRLVYGAAGISDSLRDALTLALL